MIWEGLVEKGLAIARMIHDRYDAFRRNPFNEIECSDHYARSMASYGVFLAACGFDYHGPKGHLAFAPRLTPEKFRAPFTAAEGWGTFSQERVGPSQRHTIEVRWGQLRLKSLAFELSKEARPGKVAVKLQDRTIAATYCLEKNQCLVALDNEIVIPKAGCLTVVIE
jgi:hypothetical protein